MGFSVMGLVLSLVVLAPNLLLLWFPPRPQIGTVRVPRAFVMLERAGQALCMTVPAITVGEPILWWFVPVAVFAIMYWALWVRFLATGRPLEALFGAVWGIPVPMALLPVLTFLAGAVWLTSPWVAISATVFAAGHIPTSMITARNR